MPRLRHILPLSAALLALTAPAARALDFGDIGAFIKERLSTPRKAGPRPLSRPPAARATRPARVPLPRPRPWGKAPAAAARAPARPPAPIATTRRGQVLVKVEELGKERDSMKDVYLAPKEKGHWSASAVKAARNRCNIVLAATNVDATPIPSIGGPQGCGIAAPVVVRALGAVELKPAAKLNCTFTAALYKWVTDVVQPAARARFHQPVVAIRQLSHYSCRRRGGITRGPVRISEHSFGNAIDVAAFTLADGTKISLLHDWGGFSALFDRKAAFLREVHRKACGIFSTVLGPEANKAHKNHFHFDLGRGGRYKYCH